MVTSKNHRLLTAIYATPALLIANDGEHVHFRCKPATALQIAKAARAQVLQLPDIGGRRKSMYYVNLGIAYSGEGELIPV